ncbi:MAG: hypothetical protein R2711_03750 [Acidimicrobiales bacterium]
MALRTEPAVPERLVLGGVDHLHAELGAIAEVRADLVGEERHRHDDLVDAVLLSRLTMCSIIGRFASGSIGFGHWTSGDADGCLRRLP